MPFFSVIVPIYKTEAYLRECVDSVLCQSFRDFELILVDDGSPDGCPAICDEYAAKDSRVRVIHKENGGLSDARNAGMRVAQGVYYCFLDSDDFWASPECLEVMHREIEAGRMPDIAVYRFLFQKDREKEQRPTAVVYESDRLNTLTPIEAIRLTISRGQLLSSASEGCYRGAFLLEHELFFTKGIRGEDTEWIIRMYGCLPRIWYTNHLFYVYRSRAGSITKTANLSNASEYAEFLIRHTESMDPSKELDRLRLCYIAYHYLVCLANAKRQGGRESRELLKRLYHYKFLMKYDLMPKVKLAHRVCRIVGIRMTARLLAAYQRSA